jgi:hypothetical protein
MTLRDFVLSRDCLSIRARKTLIKLSKQFFGLPDPYLVDMEELVPFVTIFNLTKTKYCGPKTIQEILGYIRPLRGK